MQQRRQQQQHQSQRIFTASDVAEYEYCSLAWWHGQFEPAAHEDNEELFARLVEMEHEHGTQAPALPDYQMIEQLLLRRGAFEQGRQQHAEHAEEVAEMEEERIHVPSGRSNTRRIAVMILVIVVIALLLIAASLVLR